MTEAEWLACDDPAPMFPHLRRRWNLRRRLLFCVACVRRVSAHLGARSRARLDRLDAWERRMPAPGRRVRISDDAMSEADGLSYRMGTPEGLAQWAAASAVWAAADLNWIRAAQEAAWAVEAARGDIDALRPSPTGPSPGDAGERRAQAALLRCLFTREARRRRGEYSRQSASIAMAAFDERLASGELDPLRLHVLADALEEAGADSSLITHLREPGPHVRGCWAIDAVLGKG